MKGRVASIDYGLKRIGVALSDERRVIASSLGVVETEKTNEKTIQSILNLLKSYNVSEIIVGNPIHMNGKESVLAGEVKQFADLLQRRTESKVVLWDERLTSAQADKMLMGFQLNRKKRAQKIDSVSAIILLQSYLECHG